MTRWACLLFSVLCLAQEPGPYHVEAISSKHKFIEGPVWSARDGYLLFADVPMNTIQKIDRNGLSMFREQSGGASGNAFDDKGRLYTCETHARRITRTDKKGAVETLAEQFEGKKLNGPNDIAVTKHGHVYFTDPAFGSAGDTARVTVLRDISYLTQRTSGSFPETADSSERYRCQPRRRRPLRSEF